MHFWRRDKELLATPAGMGRLIVTTAAILMRTDQVKPLGCSMHESAERLLATQKRYFSDARAMRALQREEALALRPRVHGPGHKRKFAKGSNRAS